MTARFGNGLGLGGDIGFRYGIGWGAGATLAFINTLLPGVFAAQGLGGAGAEGFSFASQLFVQAEGVVITMVWSSIVAFIAYKIVDMVVGLPVGE